MEWLDRGMTSHVRTCTAYAYRAVRDDLYLYYPARMRRGKVIGCVVVVVVIATVAVVVDTKIAKS